MRMKTKLSFILMIFIISSSCSTSPSVNASEIENGLVKFENGDLMTADSLDSMGNEFHYSDGEAAITSQVKVLKPGVKTPWHYHPYTGVVYVLQGELTVNFDTVTTLDNRAAVKSISTTQSFKAGDKAFLSVSNTWHYSENRGDNDLIFMATWLGEKNEPVAVFQ